MGTRACSAHKSKGDRVDTTCRTARQHLGQETLLPQPLPSPCPASPLTAVYNVTRRPSSPFCVLSIGPNRSHKSMLPRTTLPPSHYFFPHSKTFLPRRQNKHPTVPAETTFTPQHRPSTLLTPALPYRPNPPASASMITEIVTFTLAPSHSLSSPTSPASKTIREFLTAELDAEGAHDAYFGAFDEKPDRVIMLVKWESVEAHRRYMQSAYVPRLPPLSSPGFSPAAA